MARDSGAMESSYSALADKGQDWVTSDWSQVKSQFADLEERAEEKSDGTEEFRAMARSNSDGSWLTEAKAQAVLAWPMMLTNLLSFSFIIVSLMFVGHLGELELSSASIANSVASVTGFTVMLGLASALETLCGQAYGAKAYHLMGIQLQAAAIVTLSFCIPIGALWWNLESVLLKLGQDPEISKLAASYCRCILPGLLSVALLQPLIRYLQTQSVVMPMMLCSLLTALFHPVLCYLLIYRLGFGYHGGALAMMLSYWILLILLFLYTAWSGVCSETWHGLQLKEAIVSVPLYLKLAIPAVCMICLDYWSFEIVVLLSGILPNPQLELSLLSISLNITALAFMIPFGLSVAASTRVSNALGGGNPGAAKLAVKVVLCLSLVQACVIASVMILIRDLWAHAFSDIEEIVNYVADVMPLLACLTLCDGVQAVLSGVVRGSGRLELGASINLGAFYGVGIPLALLFAFKFHLNAKGLIIGLITGLGTQTLLLLFFVLRTNWKGMADKAQKRISSQPREPLLTSYLESSQMPFPSNTVVARETLNDYVS